MVWYGGIVDPNEMNSTGIKTCKTATVLVRTHTHTHTHYLDTFLPYGKDRNVTWYRQRSVNCLLRKMVGPERISRFARGFRLRSG